MNKIWDVAVAGEIYADHIFSGFERWPAPGEEHFTDHYVREAGGGAAITACALGRLGRKVALFAVMGEQDQWLRQRLQPFGIHLDDLRQASTATAVSVSISTREDRSFFTWPGANRDLARYLREPETQLRLAQACHVHFALPIDRDLAADLFPRLHAAGCSLSLDVGHHPNWLRDPASWLSCGEVDFFLPNQKEAEIITGRTEQDQLLSALRDRGIPRVVLKLGRNGASALLDGIHHHAAALPVHAVDTTGAGDAFNAGLIDAVLDQAAPGAILERACLCGSLSTRATGALSAIPDRKELNHFHDQLRQQ